MRAVWVILATFVLGGALAGSSGVANAAPTASPAASFRSLMGADERGEKSLRSRDAGTIEGVVTAVDYRKGLITLQSPGRGRLDVVVLPSTTFEGRGTDFQAFSDVVRGAKVEILASRRGDFLVAQVVRLK
jgi:Cu/Ag efflux protein CusF